MKLTATLQIVILLFSRTSSFPQSTFSSVLLVDGLPKCLVCLTEVTPLLNLENYFKTQQTLIFQRLAVEIHSSSCGHHLVGVLDTVVLHYILIDIYNMFVKERLNFRPVQLQVKL
jgi:hypothetical protein